MAHSPLLLNRISQGNIHGKWFSSSIASLLSITWHFHKINATSLRNIVFFDNFFFRPFSFFFKRNKPGANEGKTWNFPTGDSWHDDGEGERGRNEYPGTGYPPSEWISIRQKNVFLSCERSHWLFTGKFSPAVFPRISRSSRARLKFSFRLRRRHRHMHKNTRQIHRERDEFSLLSSGYLAKFQLWCRGKFYFTFFSERGLTFAIWQIQSLSRACRKSFDLSQNE